MERQLHSSQFIKEQSFPFWIRRFFHDHEHVPLLHGHDFVELVYIVRGEAQHVFAGNHYEIRAGDVFIINPGEVHTYSIQPGKEIEIINCLFLSDLIQGNWLLELGISQSMDYFYVHPFLDKRERFHRRLNLNGQDATRTLLLLETIMNEFDSRYSGFESLIRLQMVELLILLSRAYQQAEGQCGREPVRWNSKQLLVRRICGYLERYYDKKLSIPDLCELFTISPRQLNRVFKEALGMTVVNMIHQIRIERAKHLLLETDEKVITIAGKVGYEDPAFFSRLFHRQVGCSPGKYRESS
ncbi:MULTISPECIES: AraC family transcriptional regulator [Paenibacillus]|uniref:AraC family transcriptional regulator n=1 Tax=Paenibacillus radicis (ex Xue et al. 2023) TaxID=2972489 RepID=A0ABT1YE25_9BACL|nr:AraC family transcriptional regulator [Paenibacillus radicis (ex Xue et al. 2023)]MCR8630674.1 AraC family transcriptional regulator [Paenibacillus radicis (ex Xue et al. 2023)]